MTEYEIKRNLNKKVRFSNARLYVEKAEYILTGAIIRRGDKGFYYQAELQDIHNENSILICKLDEIEEEQNNEQMRTP